MAESGDLDFEKEYGEYLQRFERAVGQVDYGAFVKHNGRLVKKLTYEDFAPLYREYFQVAKTYFDAIDRGDTINDVVVRILRERATELFLASPV